MSKNILIFSDGTGQAGGLLPDQTISNVYKLYRSMRCGPDSTIDPASQLAFYDPGLGSQSDGGRIKIGFVRKLRNLISQGTGLESPTTSSIAMHLYLIYGDLATGFI